jgi:DNA-binding GntR family transcriptional regulator
MLVRAKLLLRRHPRAAVAGALAAALVPALAVWRSSGDVGSTASASVVVSALPESAESDCSSTVLDTLGRVLMRAYREGVSSERTRSAQHLIAGSVALRQAVQRDDAAAARAAARALLATGHMSNLRVVRGSRTLVDVGGPALAPIAGTIDAPGGAPIAGYVTSVWADNGFVAEAQGIAQGLVALRSHGRSVGGSLSLPAGELPETGVITRRHVTYQFASFAAQAYPAGAVRVYLLVPTAATVSLCGATAQDTLVNTLARVANLIYAGEGGRRTLAQIHRVQQYRPLLDAVAQRDPAATKQAVQALLHHHLVRLRVRAGGSLLSDVGGPYVLAPVSAPLRRSGRTIGSFVLSIQDDEGYKRLAGRLAGLDVLMYVDPAHPKLVKNSLGPNPGDVPASGRYRYRGHDFRALTVNATAFPSGPLTIRVLVPIPYT